jgi:hypothetical protein
MASSCTTASPSSGAHPEPSWPLLNADRKPPRAPLLPPWVPLRHQPAPPRAPTVVVNQGSSPAHRVTVKNCPKHWGRPLGPSPSTPPVLASSDRSPAQLTHPRAPPHTRDAPRPIHRCSTPLGHPTTAVLLTPPPPPWSYSGGESLPPPSLKLSSPTPCLSLGTATHPLAIGDSRIGQNCRPAPWDLLLPYFPFGAASPTQFGLASSGPMGTMSFIFFIGFNLNQIQ